MKPWESDKWNTGRHKTTCLFSINLSFLLGCDSSVSLLLCLLRMGAAAKSLQSCLTLCNPIDSSPRGSPIPGIHQARTLEWVAISSSNSWKWKVKVNSLSRARLLATPWTVAYQAPPFMGFSRQEYWSGLPFPWKWDSNKLTCHSLTASKQYSPPKVFPLISLT